MRVIYQNKTYDTDTAMAIEGYIERNTSPRDSYSETLYKAIDGTIFLHCTGGPDTVYGIEKNGERKGGQMIIPLTKKDLKYWRNLRKRG